MEKCEFRDHCPLLCPFEDLTMRECLIGNRILLYLESDGFKERLVNRRELEAAVYNSYATKFKQTEDVEPPYSEITNTQVRDILKIIHKLDNPNAEADQ